MKIACVLVGGPDREISVGGKRYRFEMHPYFGPGLVNKNGDVAANQQAPRAFWEAVSLWAQQGQPIDPTTGLCIWFHEPAPILDRKLKAKGINLVRGYKEPQRGE